MLIMFYFQVVGLQVIFISLFINLDIYCFLSWMCITLVTLYFFVDFTMDKQEPFSKLHYLKLQVV